MRVWGLVLAIGVVAGCGGDDAAAVDDDEARLVERASEVRELRLLRDVTFAIVDRDAYLAAAADDVASIPDEEIAAYAETYGRMGFFDRSVDVRELLVARKEAVLGYYAFGSDRVVLVGEWQEDVALHELIHALQDQHFAMSGYASGTTSDQYLARIAGLEGDADLARFRYVIQEEDGIDLHQVDWAPRLAEEIEGSEALLASTELPPYFEAARSFAYPYGFLYAASNVVGVRLDRPDRPRSPPFDWSLQDRMLEERSLGTTEQVLRLDADDEVVPVGLTAVPSSLEGRLETVDWDTLGSWYTYLLLRPGVGPGAAAIAAGWDGDTALFVRDRDDRAIGFVWATAWDDEDAASSFAGALLELYGADADASRATALDGEDVHVVQAGSRIAVAKNVASDVAIELATAALGAVPTPAASRSRASLAEWLGDGATHVLRSGVVE